MATVFAPAITSTVAVTGAVTVPGRRVTAPVIRSQISVSGAATIRPFGTDRRVIITTVDGTPIAELENAYVMSFRRRLNEAETWGFTLPTSDPKLAAVLGAKVREVQLWRGDQLLSWGPMTNLQVGAYLTTVQVTGAMWHLGRRHIGKPIRTNYVDNGDFEQGLAHWDATSNIVHIQEGRDNAQGPPVHSIVRSPTVAGKRAVRLQNTVAEADAWLMQRVFWEVEPSTSPDGDVWTLVAYVWIDTFTAPAYENRGLFVVRYSTTESYPGGGAVVLETANAPITEDTPTGSWQRMQVTFQTPVTGEEELIHVRLYAPQGVAYWDRVALTLDERTAYYQADQATIAAELVEHLQDEDYGKSDVNIAAECPLTGVPRTRIYPHAEHLNGLGAIEEFTGLVDGFDIDVAYTPTARIFRTHYPQKGQHRPRFALEIGRYTGTFAWTFQGEQAATAVIVLGADGSGSGREEASAVDTSEFDGLTLEEVWTAPPSSTIDGLEDLALERLVSTTAPETLTVRLLRPTGALIDPVGILAEGDTIPVRFALGAFSLADTYRIGAMTLNPDDTLDLSLNLRSLA